MVSATEDGLFGLVGLHYSLVGRAQLVVGSELLAIVGDSRPLGELLVEKGLLTARQHEQLLAVQRDVLAKQEAQAAQKRALFKLDEPGGLNRLLEHTLRCGASDLHLHSGATI